MENGSFLEKLAAQFGQNASVKSVFGEPIKAGDKTIIPVAQIAYGLGGGYGKRPKKIKKYEPAVASEESALQDEKKINEGEGGGGGGGMRAIPRGVYEVTPFGTRFIPANNTRPLLIGLSIGLLLSGWFFPRLRHKVKLNNTKLFLKK